MEAFRRPRVLFVRHLKLQVTLVQAALAALKVLQHKPTKLFFKAQAEKQIKRHALDEEWLTV